jgi:carbon monoxide dehydrogenase subunit G
MRIEGSYAFPAPPERILQTLADADVLCAALPGCERLIQLGPPARDGSTCYEARLRLHERVYVADLTVIPNPEARRVLLRLNGRSPDGPFHGEGELALAVPLSDDGHTQGTYTLELEAPGLSETQAHALANGSGRLFACAICDQLTEDLRAREQVGNGDDTADELLRLGRVDRLIRTETALGEIVALRSEKTEPFSPVWFQYTGGMLAGLAVGLSVVAVTAATMRRLRGAHHKR